MALHINFSYYSLELRTKELESRLDLEQATRTRLEVQVSRLKETLEKVQNDVAQAKAREMQAQDAFKKSQKSLRDMREEYHVAASREQESVTKRKDLEKKLEQVESESSALKNDLRLALQRIADLQQAMEEGDDDVSERFVIISKKYLRTVFLNLIFCLTLLVRTHIAQMVLLAIWKSVCAPSK